MAKSLVVVESPAKAKTISRYLGRNYKVIALMGDVRDLPKSKLGVDIEDGFEPSYEVIASRKKVLKELKDAAKDADTILFMATDPDREGEAIGWHLAEELGKANGKKIRRLMFNDITKKGVLSALEHPTEINKQMVDAQQARRVLDRLVGYKISPLLWDKVRRGLSAGRVQSVALNSSAIVKPDRPVAFPRRTGTSARASPVAAARVRHQAAQAGRRQRQGSRTRRKRTPALADFCGVRRGRSTRSPPRNARRATRSSPASCSRHHGFRLEDHDDRPAALRRH